MRLELSREIQEKTTLTMLMNKMRDHSMMISTALMMVLPEEMSGTLVAEMPEMVELAVMLEEAAMLEEEAVIENLLSIHYPFTMIERWKVKLIKD